MASDIETEIGSELLQVTIGTFRAYKALAEKALAQVSDEQLHWTPDPESNSIAVIMRHMAGNMLSRWTDFLTSDGEKPNRDRDSEFIEPLGEREAILEFWEKGWACLFATLDGLSSVDLLATVTIRQEPHTVIKALVRQTSHYGYHVGQIVYIAKHLQSEAWQTLSIARGKSKEFSPI